MNLKRLGLLMSHWHSSQYDPIYAVGSYFVDGKKYPTIEIVERALVSFESFTTNKAIYEEQSDLLELKEIIAGLNLYLKEEQGKQSSLTTYIQNGVESALWNNAWANFADEHGISLSGCQIENVSPTMPENVKDVAVRFCCDVETINQLLVDRLYEMARKADGLDSTIIDPDYAEEFGHYLTMQGLGSGVRWFDSHVKFPLKVPYVEVYAFSNDTCKGANNCDCKVEFESC
jgi:ribosomal protein L20A (L18A)